MKRMLINATQAEEKRLAVVDGQILLDYETEVSGQEQRKSNIYKALVTRIEPSLEACFVDYGEDRHGFLPFKEISRQYYAAGVKPEQTSIQEAISVGQELLVQVEKEERGNKGAALTTVISLAGRYIVLMPNNPRGGGISRRVEEDDRSKLKEAMNGLQYPRGMSIIARTAGIGRSTEELQWDLNYLLKLWTAIDNAAKLLKKPELIYQESNLVIRSLRDYFSLDIDEILIDEDGVFEQAKQFVNYVMPEHIERVKRYSGSIALFSRFQIEHQIESAYTRSVGLPSGGSIVIDHTEALVSIDVNSARAIRGSDVEETATRTNIEAAEEVARQMRLRDLGGLIVIDFIDMEDSKNRKDVETSLRNCLREDRARVQFGSISRFGLMEMSRQRLKPALNESVSMPCPRCSGSGHIRNTDSSALQILRIIQEEAVKDSTAAVQVQVPVDVVSFLLNEKRAEIAKIEAKERINIIIIPNKTLETPNYRLERLKSDDPRLENMPVSYMAAENFEQDTSEIRQENREPTNKQQPIIKGVLRDDPVPIPAVAKAVETSIFIKLWLMIKTFFVADNKPIQPVTKSKKTNNPQNRRRTTNNNNNKARADKKNVVNATKELVKDKIELETKPQRGAKKINTEQVTKTNQNNVTKSAATEDKTQPQPLKDDKVKPRGRNQTRAKPNAIKKDSKEFQATLLPAPELPLAITNVAVAEEEVSDNAKDITEQKQPARERKTRGRYGRDRREKRDEKTENKEEIQVKTVEQLLAEPTVNETSEEAVIDKQEAIVDEIIENEVVETVKAKQINKVAISSKLDVAALNNVVDEVGLQWVQSNQQKIKQIKQQIAEEQAQPIKLGRELPQTAAESNANLILVQTKQDLAKTKFGFEQ